MTPAMPSADEPRGLVDRVNGLYGRGDFAGALRAAAAVVERFGFPLPLGLRAEVELALGAGLDRTQLKSGHLEEATGGVATAMALGWIAKALEKLGRREAALVALDELEARFGEAEHQQVRDTVANSVLIRVPVLVGLGRTEEALAACDAVIESLADRTDANSRRLVGWSLVAKARGLEQLGAEPVATAALEQLVARHDELIDPKLVPHVARAMLQLGRSLLRAGHPAEALRVYDELLERFGQTQDTKLGEHVDHARQMQAYTLAQLGHVESSDHLQGELGSSSAGADAGSVELRDRRLQSAKEGLLSLRLLALVAATRYGLVLARESTWPGAVEAWRAWIELLRTIVQQPELGDQQDGSGRERSPLPLLQDFDLFALFDELERTSGGVAGDRVPRRQAHRFWLDMLEGLAGATRTSERFGMVPMGERNMFGWSGSQPGVDLLGALVDSLVLMAYGDDAAQELRASSAEIYMLLRAARDALEWTRCVRDPVALPPAADQDGEKLDNDELLDRISDLFEYGAGVGRFYNALAPDGRKLDPQEREEACEYLVAGAVCLRRLAHAPPETKVPIEDERLKGLDLDLCKTMVPLRAIQRSLVLALSDSEDRRALAAMTTEELNDDGSAASQRSP